MPFTKVPKMRDKAIEYAREDIDRLAAKIADVVLTTIPAENGHAHEALITAHNVVRMPHDDETYAVLSTHENKASGDARASKAGRGTYRETKYTVRLSIRAGLNFLAVLEDGGTLYPINPGGTKVGTPGELYGKRSKTGSGWLMWEEDGVKRFAKARTLPGYHSLQEAKQKADLLANQLGYSTHG